MREELEDALLCLLPLTAHPQQRSLFIRALGLVATSPTHPGLDALLRLSAAEGGTALQVRTVVQPSCWSMEGVLVTAILSHVLNLCGGCWEECGEGADCWEG